MTHATLSGVAGRELTLAIHLLAAAAASVALGTASGCKVGDQHETGVIELGIDADLRGGAVLEATANGINYEYLAVGVAGVVVIWGYEDRSLGDLVVDSMVVGEADLHDAWAWTNGVGIVGDAGLVATSPDYGQTWQTLDLGTTADLHASLAFDERVVIVGDEVVRVLEADGTWSEPMTPEGGWGRLRALYRDRDQGRIWAVGLGGVIWSTDDPTGIWIAEDSGVTTDLLGIDGDLAVGAAGTLLVRDAAGWTRRESNVEIDLVDTVAGNVLGEGGELFVAHFDGLRHIETIAGARAIDDPGCLLVLGEGGLAVDTYGYTCAPGRPFMVAGEPRVAALQTTLESTLARAWAEDALYEHASVASFARFALELLALGAPARLVAEVQAAIADELVHARLCFELAARYGGTSDEPGPMPIPQGAFARVGDPVATALALFEEGCINESVAACVAADAAGDCEDSAVRRTLELIAADERRHATSAWAALRWLLDSYGERVRGPLRARLARLGVGRIAEHPAGPDPLAAFGRSSPARCAEVRRRVLTELVGPLAHAMLEVTPPAAIEPAPASAEARPPAPTSPQPAPPSSGPAGRAEPTGRGAAR